MGILKGFMIFGAICFMFISFIESNNKQCLIRDLTAMFICSLVAILIHIFC